MSAYSITIADKWRLWFDREYQQRVEGDHLILWTTGISVLTTLYSYSGDRGRELLLANLEAKAEAKGLETIKESEGDLIRFGYLQPEEVRPGLMRLALHAFTMAEFDCLQTSVYLDRVEDLHSGLEIWKNLEHLDKEALEDER